MSRKMEPSRMALITGANRGIGFEIAKQLAGRSYHVVIASRNESSGRAAAEAIQKGEGNASFIRLDVNDSASVRAGAEKFAEISGALHVLINNAAIYPDEGISILTLPRNRLIETLQTNTAGPLEVTQAFLPYLRQAAGARVINFSSSLGQLNGMSAAIPSYSLSKLAINGLTIMLSQALRADGVSVNSVCPGWVRTDMGGPNAPLSIEEGADTAVWLADEAPQTWTGKFYRGRKEIPW